MTQQDYNKTVGNGGTPAKSKIQRQTGQQRLSLTVIEAVAELTEADPEQMQPLYDVIDPEALDQLFQQETVDDPQSPRDFVTFQFEGCDVTVYSDGGLIAALRETA